MLVFLESFAVVATAALAQVEIAAALAKAVRQDWIDRQSAVEAWEDFLGHWPAYTRLPDSASRVERATQLVWQHSLGAFDAIHLACALTWQEATGEETVFACFDKRLRQAASEEGLKIWPAEV